MRGFSANTPPGVKKRPSKTKISLKLGIMDLTPSDSVDTPGSTSDLDDAFANPVVDGVAVRTQWSKVNTDVNTFDWTWPDYAVTLSRQTGKKFSLLVTAGVTTPSWVYSQGAYQFHGSQGDMPLPWDLIFQQYWLQFLNKFYNRYGNNPNMAYVVMGGFGRRAESFFAANQADMDALDAKARADGFVDGLDAWKTGTKWVIDQYGRLSKCAFILDLGAPYPTTAGNDALYDVCGYGDLHYKGVFAVKSDGLAQNGPPNNSVGVIEVQALSPHALVGYQFNLPAKPNVQKMINILNRGIGFGAHFIECYQGDCDYQPHWPALMDASSRMKA